MNFLTDKIRPIYFKYLAAAFGSALITSIYGVVDLPWSMWAIIQKLRILLWSMDILFLISNFKIKSTGYYNPPHDIPVSYTGFGRLKTS